MIINHNVNKQQTVDCNNHFDIQTLNIMYQKSYLHYLLILLILYLCFTLLLSFGVQVCNKPQKAAYLSFSFLSKRDSLPNLFHDINSEFISYNAEYNDSDTKYVISDLKPSFYYNEHHQVDSFVDEQISKVQMGSVKYAYNMSFSILKNEQILKKGSAFGQVQAEEWQFTKKILLNNGSIEWQPSSVQDLKIYSQIPISYSDKELTPNQALIFEMMLNDQVSERGLKAKILASFNIYFKELLKKYLNQEHLFNNTNFTYTYSGYSVNFVHHAQRVKLNNSVNPGLNAQFTFQIVNKTQNCSDLPTQFNAQYGGVQQLISMNTIVSTFFNAVQNKLFIFNIDKNWETKTFQFFMGDLANVIFNAAEQLPHSAFFGKCEYLIGQKGDLSLSAYSQYSLLAQIPTACKFYHSEQNIFDLNFTANLVLKLVAQNNYTDVVIQEASSIKQKIKAIKPGYQINNQNLAINYLNDVLKKTIGNKVFGSGWETIYRRYPSCKVLSNYILLFDTSEAMK